jgi:hypothetical protein
MLPGTRPSAIGATSMIARDFGYGKSFLLFQNYDKLMDQGPLICHIEGVYTAMELLQDP